MMNENKELIFLLGAGSTFDAGMPTATGLTEIIEKRFETNFPDLLPVLRFITGAIQFGRACKNLPLTKTINIEELLMSCSFLAKREQHFVYPFVGAWHEQIAHLQNASKSLYGSIPSDSFTFIFDYCKSNLKDWLAIQDQSRLKYLWSFRDFVNKGYKLRLFTLNYDQCLEHALSEVIGEINKEWTNGFNISGWSPHLLSNESYKAYLYKLHGSLDWVDDERLGICSCCWPLAKDIEELPETFEPLVIFGRDEKLQAVDPFLTLLYHFRQVLNSCKILIIIGYGFGDVHINSLIREALQRDPEKRCIIVNRNPLDRILPSDFKHFLAVEQRFRSIIESARNALEQNKILVAVEEDIKIQKTSEPF